MLYSEWQRINGLVLTPVTTRTLLRKNFIYTRASRVVGGIWTECGLGVRAQPEPCTGRLAPPVRGGGVRRQGRGHD